MTDRKPDEFEQRAVKLLEEWEIEEEGSWLALRQLVSEALRRERVAGMREAAEIAESLYRGFCSPYEYNDCVHETLFDRAADLEGK